jgi:acetyl esterase/lipase
LCVRRNQGNAAGFYFHTRRRLGLGDYPTHRRLVRDLVVLSGCAAVFINYTRTPEAVYPQQINEIYAATEWVAENGSEIGVDGKNLAIVVTASAAI